MPWVNCTDQELCTYLRGLEEGYLATRSSDTNASVPSKSITIASKSWTNGKKTGCFHGFQFTMIFALSTESHGEESPTSLRPDSHVSHSQRQANELEKTMSATCGPIPYESFAKLDPDTASWRTYQVCLFTNTSEPYSKTWPRAGMIVGGTAYLRVPLAPRTKETGSGLWYTPEAKNQEGYQVVGGKKYPRLGAQVKNWPTPRTITGGAESAKRKQELGRTKSGGGDLQAAVKESNGGIPTRQTYPTPSNSMMTTGDMEQARYAGNDPKRPSYRQANTSFQESTHENQKGQRGQLNPDWVEWLMGWPIGWTALKPLGMGRFARWCELHGISCRKE